MIIIQEQANIFKKVIGEQQVSNILKYRMLNFCLRVEKDDKYLIFNNLTKELLLLSGEEANLINTGNFDLNLPFVRQLAEKWFLVPDDHDDIKFSNEVTNLAKQFVVRDCIDKFCVTTTTACNARCFYCFEAGAKVSTMSTDTAINVANFMMKKCKGNEILINWFGGEPLCNINAINVISQTILNADFKYNSRIVTNGYLFNDENIKLAKELWNLKQAQITLDGMQETYNRVKNYKGNDANPFARVISNIGKLLQSDISVLVRLNMDQHNVEELQQLIDYLYAKYGQFKKFKVYVQMLFEEVGFEKIQHTNFEREYISTKYFELRHHLEDLGLWGVNKILSREVKTNFCLADSYDYAFITPEGNLGHCENYVDSKFYGDVINTNVLQPWSDYYEPVAGCYDCAYYPICMRLKDCPNCSSVCFEHDKQRHLLDLKNQVVLAYDKYLAKNN